MTMERLDATEKLPENQGLLSRADLILPKEPSPKALGLLKRAEEVGLGGIFAVHSLSGIRLTKDTQVLGWNKKPEDWYWEQIKSGTIGKDAARLPDVEILIDKTRRPNYLKDGKQLHENDPLGSFMARLRKEKKISSNKGISETSRFWASPDPELTQVILPEMAKLLGEDASEVRLPTEIEFNILGNLIYRHFGEVDTTEWLNEKFLGERRLFGGNSVDGGVTSFNCLWSDDVLGHFTFRPLVVVSPKA